MRNFICKTLHLLLVVILLTPLARAQQGGGIIGGHVQDPSGASVKGAEVTISNPASQQTIVLKTNGDGNYTSPSLSLGTYSVTIKQSGFRPEQRNDVLVEVDARLQVNFTLTLGSADESVTVSSEGVHVNVESTELGTVFNSRSIEELPVNGRAVLALTQLTPGVTSNAGATNKGFGDRGSLLSAVTINNGPNAANAVLIDGQNDVQTYINEVSINPAADAIQEFKVESGVIAPEYGFLAGGVINMVSRAGTNKYHGTAYEFLRNDAFDANNYFTGVSRLRYNQFGGTFGGPIGTKTVFFGNYEEYRYKTFDTSLFSVPTVAWKNGDFSDLRSTSGALIKVYDPTTTRPNPSGSGFIRDQYPGNKIPDAKIDAVAKAINAFYPDPNRTPDNANTQTNNYQGPTANARSMRQYLARVDRSWSEKHTMFARYAYYLHYTDTGGGIYSVIQPFLGHRDDHYANYAAILEDTYIFSPSLINEARLNVLRTNFTFQAASANQGWPQKLGLPSSVPPTTFPRISNGFATVSTAAVGKRAATNPQFSDIVTLVRGKHSMRFGVDFRIDRGYNTQTAQPSGLYNFATGLTGNPQSQSGTGYPFASFMAGAVTSATVDTILGASQINHSYSFFFQDTWKITDRLTLNLGVRYDRQIYPYEQNNGESNFNPFIKDPNGLMGAMEYAGVNGVPRAPRDTDNTDFAPRVGFAWNVFGNGKTSVRGGYAVYYPTIFSTDFFGATTGFASTITTYSAPGGDTNQSAFYLHNGFPYAPTQPLGASLGPDGFLGGSVTYDARNEGTTPQSQQFVLSVQQALPFRSVLDIAYAGNHGTHFVAGTYSMNQINPSYLSLGKSLQDPVPNPYYSVLPSTSNLKKTTITRQQSLLPFPYYVDVSHRFPHDGNFIGHSLQISWRKQMSKGLTAVVGYTKSKLIDNSISTPVSFNGVVQATKFTYQNNYDREAERSIDPLDRSQILNISAVYDLPFGKGKTFFSNAGPVLNRFIGGFQLNTVTQFKAGLPLTISGANNKLATRPNFFPGRSAKSDNPTLARWFNVDAFVNPEDYTFGNVPRTLPNVRGPGVINSDLSVFKVTPIYENLKLELRVEAFNVFNHPNFGLPGMTFVPGTNGQSSTATFGKITDAADPRQIQLAAKLRF
ncbi:MAG: TonB-dependent receptor [Acidobacteria bacterium]|nr:TonB-dependent receptor [Acidobacteriota bacterium]